MNIHAEEINLKGLTEQQQLEIKMAIEQKKQASTTNTPAKVSEWLGIGKQVAELIPVFAEKTGTAADRVLTTSSGKILLAIVLVNFFWSKLAALGLIFIVIPMWWSWFKKMFLLDKQEVTIHPNKILAFLGFNKRLVTYKTMGNLSDTCNDTRAVWLLIASAVLIALIASSLVLMFI